MTEVFGWSSGQMVVPFTEIGRLGEEGWVFRLGTDVTSFG